MTDAEVLRRFGPATREWFRAAFAAPTAAQAGAWQAIGAGHHTLVVAPTGAGKTLAAFLWSLDRLAHEPAPAEPRRRCRILYVSPLKALAVDVERNLRAPLTGIRQASGRLGVPPPDITVGMRTGDTPAGERRGFARTPPDILITTPESLFLILTSAARESLRGVETVIVDEIHAVAATKRGAHLALSLERLDQLLDRPAQRVGLSATVRPIQDTARFLGGGGREVEIVRPAGAKSIEVSVQVPVEDMTRMDEVLANGKTHRPTIWPALERRVYDLIRAHGSTIVFVNNRGAAEQLCARINELADEREVRSRPSADVLLQVGGAGGALPVIARAHHGSVSREERKQIEEALKSGRLPAVVATSSLELGIDMGAVDLVVQIEAPPSVAAGLQRIGRAGHQVGAVSRGVVIPKHRGDLVSCLVVAERMSDGEIEELRYPRNPLDVLAQQIVAMVAMEPWPVDDLAAVVRRAAPYAELPDSALHAVLDMLSGRYPSTAFAELRPRLIWDRDTGLLTGRPGAQRLAVTSGGTIPDRGLYGVFLNGSAKPARVGELDEEMVHESRVGDVFLLGSTSWRIDEITHDRVLVTPAPGAPARMPYWKSGQLGRPVELGRAIAARLRALGRADDTTARTALRDGGMDQWAADNLLAYLRQQQEATTVLPDDRTVVVERFRDEVGDWRLAVHCPLGARVNNPWALVLGHRITERYGFDAQVLPSDDGILIRVPDTAGEPPGAELITLDADEVTAEVERLVGGSALFAARFRECATRALLLPRRDPRRRQPLWQQRQRSAQLLGVARDFPSFPITLEAARECLRDVYDLPELAGLMRSLAARTVRLVEVETPRPSPFARNLLFGYAAVFVYELDAPLAERRAEALALDPTLLGELLGRVALRDLLDRAVVDETGRELQWLSGRRVRDPEDVADMLRQLGDLTGDELTRRGADPGWLRALAADRRAVATTIGGEQRWISADDEERVRAGLHDDTTALDDLIARYARTHGPFTTGAAAARFGLDERTVGRSLDRLSDRGLVTAGEYTPATSGAEWCHTEVLRMVRRRSLAALRKEIEPVEPAALAAFLPGWHQVGSAARGIDAVAAVLAQLQAVAVPASAWEQHVLPARVADYSSADLDELCASGEIVWAGTSPISAGDGWLTFAYAEAAPLLLPPPAEVSTLEPLHRAVLDALGPRQGMFFRDLCAQVAPPDEGALRDAIWDLVWAGWLTNDTLGPVRALLGGRGAHRTAPTGPRVRYRRPGAPAPAAPTPAVLGGRWSVLPPRDLDPVRRTAAMTEVLLERHGVLTRGAVAAEGITGGFAAAYQVLAALEDRGGARRGYFVEGLGAAQFAVPGAVDQLRADPRERDGDAGVLVLAATDPANPYGAALPWPSTGTGARPGRRPGGLVALDGGALLCYLERGGRTLLTFTDDERALTAVATALAGLAREGRLGSSPVEEVDGGPVHTWAAADVFVEAGFRLTARGLWFPG